MGIPWLLADVLLLGPSVLLAVLLVALPLGFGARRRSRHSFVTVGLTFGAAALVVSSVANVRTGRGCFALSDYCTGARFDLAAAGSAVAVCLFAIGWLLARPTASRAGRTSHRSRFIRLGFAVGALLLLWGGASWWHSHWRHRVIAYDPASWALIGTAEQGRAIVVWPAVRESFNRTPRVYIQESPGSIQVGVVIPREAYRGVRPQGLAVSPPRTLKLSRPIAGRRIYGIGEVFVPAEPRAVGRWRGHTGSAPWVVGLSLVDARSAAEWNGWKLVVAPSFRSNAVRTQSPPAHSPNESRSGAPATLRVDGNG